VVYLPRIVRVTRGVALSVIAQEYVMAARALGSPSWRLVLRTVLPNCLSVVVVQLSLYFAEVLLAEAALSFLGLGEPPPTPTWGNILYDSQKYIRNAPWIAFFPGCAIALSVLGLNLFGDAVRDAMDPRLRTWGSAEAMRGRSGMVPGLLRQFVLNFTRAYGSLSPAPNPRLGVRFRRLLARRPGRDFSARQCLVGPSRGPPRSG
jgi:hypothetical protein